MSTVSSPVTICWYGQSSFLVKAAEGSLMVDPYFPLWRPEAEFIHAESPLDESKTVIDAVLVTHDHRDHNCPDSLQRFLQANPRLRLFGPQECVERWQRCRLPMGQCQPIKAGDSFEVAGFEVRAVLAKPPGGDPSQSIAPPDVEHLGFVVIHGDTRIYISGDPINNLHEQDEIVESVRALLPQIGIFTTHPDEGEFPFFQGVWAAAERMGIRTVIPAHYHCFRKRSYDPQAFAALTPDGFETVIIHYGGSHTF